MKKLFLSILNNISSIEFSSYLLVITPLIIFFPTYIYDMFYNTSGISYNMSIGWVDEGDLIGIMTLTSAYLGYSFALMNDYIGLDAKTLGNACFISIMYIITIILGFASIYLELGLIGNCQGVVYDPVISIYFSVITWTSVGYGDFSPSLQARPYAALEAFIGYIFMATLISIYFKLASKS